MMKLKCSIISLCFVLLSCNQNNVYHKMDDDFASNRWENKDQKKYDFAIEDDTKAYDLTIVFSHVYDYQFDKVPFTIVLTNPEGVSENITFDLQIKAANGKDLADCGGDFCDLKYTFKKGAKLQKGNYTAVLSHQFNGPYLPNVLGVGLNVDKVE